MGNRDFLVEKKEIIFGNNADALDKCCEEILEERLHLIYEVMDIIFKIDLTINRFGIYHTNYDFECDELNALLLSYINELNSCLSYINALVDKIESFKNSKDKNLLYTSYKLITYLKIYLSKTTKQIKEIKDFAYDVLSREYTRPLNNKLINEHDLSIKLIKKVVDKKD